MDESIHRYLGPYAELPVKLHTEVKDQCGDPPRCPNPTSGASCPQCGVSVGRRFHSFQKARPPLPPVIARVLNDSVLLADGRYGPERVDDDNVIYRLIPNYPTEVHAARDFYLPEGDCWLDMTAIDRQAEMDWFEDQFSFALTHLKKTYGELHLKWGLLQWEE